MNAKSRKVLATTVDSSHLTKNDYLDLRFEEVLDRISADGLAPGGGSAAAFTVAFAARLVAVVARRSPGREDAAGRAAGRAGRAWRHGAGGRGRRARDRPRAVRRPRLGCSAPRPARRRSSGYAR